ncbi:DgyrCDS11220 [Dimorphilus gyrociliatus]|uniref:DgyrCDS11220 n=1 Tax=Dimorphilus gyrociliatus TaxID=2664684 RepID=A0A7I8W4J6_9ANNE|nr:DgyrCDS11220 [Dimorphilus gyrociliatus]
MEAVPRLPMMSFESKQCSDSVEFTPVLRSYILNHYGENPSKYEKALEELENLRTTATKCSKDLTRCSILKKYYAQLHMLHNRFPMGEADPVAVAFTWDDAFGGSTVVHADIKFEQACILYNIGCLYSSLGASDTRNTQESLKASCTHFQIAAGAFETVRDSFNPSYSSDFDSDVLTFQSNLLLAQAQECILEKSMSENRKSTITTKIAARIRQFYTECQKILELKHTAKILGAKKHKEWKKRIDLRIIYHHCLTYFYSGMQAEETEKWGERLMYFEAALEQMQSCLKLAKDSIQMEETVRFVNDVVTGKFNSAKKDNDFVYHAKVPKLEDFTPVEGATLVKGIIFDHTDVEISGLDIFRELVPLEAHEASSIYSEEKAKLLRVIGTEVSDADEELTQRMNQLAFDKEFLNIDKQVLPDSVLEKCAAISAMPNSTSDLRQCLHSLSGAASKIEEKITKIHNIIAKEKRNEDTFQKTFGKRQVDSRLIELGNNAEESAELVDKAAQTTQVLCQAMDDHIANLKLLCDPQELNRNLPNRSILTENEEDVKIIKQMIKLMEKIDEMVKQRKLLETSLRDAIHSDDITKVIAGKGGTQDQEEYFRTELKKHDENLNLLRQNIGAQTNILKALAECYVKFAPIRRELSEIDQKRNKKIESLIESFDVYTDLINKWKNGMEFYDKRDAIITNILAEVEKRHAEQEAGRKRIMEKYGIKEAVKPDIDMQPNYIPNASDLCGETGMTHSEMKALGMQIPQNPSLEDPSKKKTLKDHMPYMQKRSERTKGKKNVTNAKPENIDIDDQEALAAIASLESAEKYLTSNFQNIPSLPGKTQATLANSSENSSNAPLNSLNYTPTHQPPSAPSNLTKNFISTPTIPPPQGQKGQSAYKMSYEEQEMAAAAVAMFDQAIGKQGNILANVPASGYAPPYVPAPNTLAEPAPYGVGTASVNSSVPTKK